MVNLGCHPSCLCVFFAYFAQYAGQPEIVGADHVLRVVMEVLVIANIQYFDRNSDPTRYIAWELFAWVS